MIGLALRALLAVLLIASGWQVFQQLVARQAARFLGAPEAYHEAIRWDPEEADYQLGLGVHYQALLDPDQAARARPHLERAAELNPFDPRALQELATLYELAGDRDLAESAHLSALRLRPTNGDLLWRVGNFYLRSGELPKALPQLAAAMSADPRLVRVGADLLLSVGVAPAEVERLVPADPVARRRLLDVLSTRLGASPPEEILFTTLRVWREQLAAGELTVDQGVPVINRLVRARLDDVARREWAALNAVNGHPDPVFESGANLIWNGDFERPIFGGELDWVLPAADSYVASVDPRGGRDGSRALRVAIGGKVPSGLQRVEQLVIPDAGGRFELSAWLRVEGFRGAPMPRLEVYARGTRRPLATLEAPPRNGRWHSARVTFEIADSRDPLVVRWSDRARDGTEGIGWVDSIVLRPAE